MEASTWLRVHERERSHADKHTEVTSEGQMVYLVTSLVPAPTSRKGTWREAFGAGLRFGVGASWAGL